MRGRLTGGRLSVVASTAWGAERSLQKKLTLRCPSCLFTQTGHVKKPQHLTKGVAAFFAVETSY